MHYIYKITHLVNNKAYIGQTKDVKQRWRAHRMAFRNNRPTQTIHHALIKYGIDNFSFEIIASCLDQRAANEAEEICIKQENSYVTGSNGYNCSLGGSVAPKTEEWKAKVVATRKANGSYKQSEETKKRLSDSWALHHPPESVAKTAEANRGQIRGPHSEETKQKIGAANKIALTGKKQPEEMIAKRIASIAEKYGDKTCNAPDCDRTDGFKVDGVRYCWKHAQRLKDTGTLELRPRPTPNKGKKMSDESKEKLSTSLKGKLAGNKNPFFGKQHIPEMIEYLRQINLGKEPPNKMKFSEEVIRQIIDDKRSLRKIAQDHGVSTTVIQRIKNV